MGRGDAELYRFGNVATDQRPDRVLDDVVRVEIDLPWIMRLLGDTVAKQVRGRGVALLEKPPGEA